MLELDPRLEILLLNADFSDQQKQSLRDTWTSIKAKGNAESLSTQHAIFSYALAVSMGGSLSKIEEINKSMNAVKEELTTPSIHSVKNRSAEMLKAFEELEIEAKLDSIHKEATEANAMKWRILVLIILVIFIAGIILGCFMGIILIEKDLINLSYFDVSR